MTQGWHNESARHAKARRGIKTSYRYKSQGKHNLSIKLPTYTKDKLKQLIRISNGNEWIAELVILNGEIIIDDVQISDRIDHSQLRWNDGDEKTNVGYIHYHPETLIPEFTSTDFILAFNMHKMRINKDKYPYTVMGLVYPEDKNHKIVLYAVNPKKGREKDFMAAVMEKGKLTYKPMVCVESDMKETINDMIKSKELIKLNEVK